MSHTVTLTYKIATFNTMHRVIYSTSEATTRSIRTVDSTSSFWKEDGIWRVKGKHDMCKFCLLFDWIGRGERWNITYEEWEYRNLPQSRLYEWVSILINQGEQDDIIYDAFNAMMAHRRIWARSEMAMSMTLTNELKVGPNQNFTEYSHEKWYQIRSWL